MEDYDIPNKIKILENSLSEDEREWYEWYKKETFYTPFWLIPPIPMDPLPIEGKLIKIKYDRFFNEIKNNTIKNASC